jgi:hypothetical protein
MICNAWLGGFVETNGRRIFAKIDNCSQEWQLNVEDVEGLDLAVEYL